MKKQYSTWLVLAAIFLFATEIAQAQIGNYRGRINAFGRNKRYLSVGFGINSLNYFGDLAPKNRIASTKLSFTRPGLNVHALYRLGPQFSIRGGFMWGRLYGDDVSSDPRETDEVNAGYRYVRNLHFRNDIKELSVGFVLDLKNNPRTFISRPDLVPYITAGIAVFHHNPKAMVPERNYVDFPTSQAEPIDGQGTYGGVSAGDWVELRPLQTEGEKYGSFAFAIPLGAGLRYKVNRYFDVAFEVNYRQTFTDYIDDVSGDYVDLNEFPNNPTGNLGRIMSYRSNEPTAVAAGEDRAEDIINAYATPIRYSDRNKSGSPLTGYDYLVYKGFGEDTRGGMRGAPDKDVYLVTNITVTYIIGTSVRNAKFR